MFLTVFLIIFLIIISLILYDVGRILKIQDELIKEQYILRGELNAIMGFQMPSFPSYEKNEIDETTTVEVTH
jgi:hypothetical protein